MKPYLVLFFTLFFLSAHAQEIKFLEEKEPGKGKIENISWLAGHWIGQVYDSKIDEI